MKLHPTGRIAQAKTFAQQEISSGQSSSMGPANDIKRKYIQIQRF